MEIGRCHICGERKPLTKEHIPPKSAFNKGKVVELLSNSRIIAVPEEGESYRVQQGGHYRFTLCSECNSKTGSWYGTSFGNWCIHGMDVLRRSEGRPALIHCYRSFPSQIVKQLMSLFLSVNRIEFRDAHPELVRFVLDKWSIGIPSTFHLYTYYNLSSILRFIPFIGYTDVSRMKEFIFSEISYPPYGYVLTIDPQPPADDLCEITHFTKYRYHELADLEMKPVVKEINTFIPGDYRTPEEIYSEVSTSKGNLVYTGNDIAESIKHLSDKMSRITL